MIHRENKSSHLLVCSPNVSKSWARLNLGAGYCKLNRVSHMNNRDPRTLGITSCFPGSPQQETGIEWSWDPTRCSKGGARKQASPATCQVKCPRLESNMSPRQVKTWARCSSGDPCVTQPATGSVCLHFCNMSTPAEDAFLQRFIPQRFLF